MIRVLLVDDHPLLREGLRTLLHAVSNMEVVGVAERAGEALEQARRLRPDVVLLDIRLKESSGIEAARALCRELPEVKVLVLSAFAYEVYVRTLLAMGVHGYLLKTASDEELIEAVRAVCRGETALSPEIAAQVTRPRRGEGDRPLALTEREREVLLLVGAGLSSADRGAPLPDRGHGGGLCEERHGQAGRHLARARRDAGPPARPHRAGGMIACRVLPADRAHSLGRSITAAEIETATSYAPTGR